MSAPVFRIIYEDKDILLIEKKKAFISQRGDEGSREGLYEFVGRQLGMELWPVHRLDREVLGLMIFGKSSKVSDFLSGQFRNRKVRKSYSAWVQGRPPEKSGRLVHYLKKNEKTNYTTVFPKPTPGAKEARLTYTLQESAGKFSRLEIDLETGRSHQIRVQLLKIGCPIVGDHRYAKTLKNEIKETSIQLKSVRLGVQHPANGHFMEWKLAPLEPLLFS